MNRHRSNGFLLADTIIGLVLISAIAMVLAVSSYKYHAATIRLRADREATDAATQGLIALQTNRALPTLDDITFKTEPRSDDWVALTATCRGRSVTLLGLVPKERKS